MAVHFVNRMYLFSDDFSAFNWGHGCMFKSILANYLSILSILTLRFGFNLNVSEIEIELIIISGDLVDKGGSSLKELEEYKGRDPLLATKHAIVENNYADEAWFAEVDAEVKSIVDESVKFAEESPFPTADELYKDVYVQEDYPFILD